MRNKKADVYYRENLARDFLVAMIHKVGAGGIVLKEGVKKDWEFALVESAFEMADYFLEKVAEGRGGAQ